jgi:hypothetical protein
LEWFRESVDDCRKKASNYELAAHLIACMAMFLFKAGSRNEHTQNSKELQFQRNFKKLFGFDMPHVDSVHNVIAALDVDQIEGLKHKMVQVLIQRKSFHSSRYRGHWFRIAVDGSGVGTYNKERDEYCLHRTSKNDKTTYFHSVLEARLVTHNGFSISIATVWIENLKDGKYDKQDCERKAFTRLATKLKALYPRLPILILADGLYPYEGFFKTCKDNHWAYCITFKSGNLPTVWREVNSLWPLQSQNTCQNKIFKANGNSLKQAFRWVTEIDYHGYTLYFP